MAAAGTHRATGPKLKHFDSVFSPVAPPRPVCAPAPGRTVGDVGDKLRNVLAAHGEGGRVAARLQQLEQHAQQLAVVVHQLLGILPPEGVCERVGSIASHWANGVAEAAAGGQKC